MNLIKCALILLLVGMWPGICQAALDGPCEKDLETFCSNVTPGQGRMIGCLKRYEPQVSVECKEWVTKFSVALRDLKDACGDDAQTYCSDVKMSYRRILHCLKEHTNELSTGCRTLLTKP